MEKCYNNIYDNKCCSIPSTSTSVNKYIKHYSTSTNLHIKNRLNDLKFLIFYQLKNYSNEILIVIIFNDLNYKNFNPKKLNSIKLLLCKGHYSSIHKITKNVALYTYHLLHITRQLRKLSKLFNSKSALFTDGNYNKLILLIFLSFTSCFYGDLYNNNFCNFQMCWCQQFLLLVFNKMLVGYLNLNINSFIFQKCSLLCNYQKNCKTRYSSKKKGKNYQFFFLCKKVSISLNTAILNQNLLLIPYTFISSSKLTDDILSVISNYNEVSKHLFCVKDLKAPSKKRKFTHWRRNRQNTENASFMCKKKNEKQNIKLQKRHNKTSFLFKSFIFLLQLFSILTTAFTLPDVLLQQQNQLDSHILLKNDPYLLKSKFLKLVLYLLIIF